MNFLGNRTGAESIDRLTLTTDQRASEKADFFLDQRIVVCEVWILQTYSPQRHISLRQVNSGDRRGRCVPKLSEEA